MNNTVTESELSVLIFNSVLSIVIMLINIHQSYKNRHCASKCCGRELIEWGSNKEKFDA